MRKIEVMVAGLSSTPGKGKMAMLISQAILAQEDMALSHLGLAEESGGVYVGDHFVDLETHESVSKKPLGKEDLIVDFTARESVNANAEWYCGWGIPFVMGTTGGDRDALAETVKKSSISAVIAANMAIPVVVIQEMLRFAAENFPDALAGFKMRIAESHQASKPDPSGTAISFLPFFRKLGIPVTQEQIEMIRDPQMQMDICGIPQEFLDGHGYHDYRMDSADDTVTLAVSHNLRGRNVYVGGGLQAIRFLHSHWPEAGKVFTMADVLRG